MLLVNILGPGTPAGLENLDITGIASDSREVRPGHLFVAVPGTRADGSAYAADAARRGAVAILVDESVTMTPPEGVALIRGRNLRRMLALLSRAIHPGQPETVVAVTGTSGKTSVAEFTRQIFAALGRKSASLGTLGVMTDAGLAEGALTTPGPVELHKMLAGLAADGITHLAMEASSHGLDQYRLDGVALLAGAFTNLGRDHMDYHPTVEAYFNAKMRMVRELLQPGQPFVVNMDGAWGDKALAVVRERRLAPMSVGRGGKTLRLDAAERDGFRQRLTLTHAGRGYDIRLPLIGAYQVENALVAAGLVLATGEPPDRVLAALENLKGVPGRLDVVGEYRGGLAVVDYAHKPEALEAVLDALRPFATGKLICVFGCGGDRDTGKRPIMGRIAVEKADVTIVTDDNPRSEKPEAIRAAVMAGAAGAREIGDRAEAIAAAVAMMGAGDVVVVAGKGHETGQKIGDTVLPFSDHEVLRAAIGKA